MFDILARHVLRQCTLRFLLLFIVFMAVLVGGQLGIFIGQGVPPEACLPLCENFVEFSLSIALPLALATSILVIIGAMNQDGELRALAASGVGHLSVVVRLWPLVALAILISLVLTNLIMPNAVANIRASKGRLAQTAIAQRVANDEPIAQEKNIILWGGAVDGRGVRDVRALITRPDEFIALFAPKANWVAYDKGVRADFYNVEVLRRHSDGHITEINAPDWAYLWPDDEKSLGQTEPDGLSTIAVYQLTQHPPAAGKDPSDFNNARLTLHFRFFLPLSLFSFALCAVGMGLTFGTAQNLPGVVAMVVLVSLTMYPAFGYVKTNVHHAQISPGWFLWPTAAVVALAGMWLTWRPERAREIIVLPFTALRDWWQRLP